MTANISQAKRYRQMVRSDLELLRHPIPHSSNPDIAFYSYLETVYNQAKGRLLPLLEQKASNSTITNERVCLFIYGAGLFTFGRLDVAEDILAGIPFMGQGGIRRLAWVLNVLLSMPKGMDALTDPDAVLKWLKVKQSKLRWDETLERSKLENFKVVSSVPSNSIPEQFIATNKEVDGEGLVVEIYPDTGSSWFDHFQFGHSDFSGVYQHPNRIYLIVVSRGQGYVINPENKQLLTTFGSQINNVIDIAELYTILFQDNSSLLCYERSGFLWENTTILWNRVREVKIEGGILTGELYHSKVNSWMPFWLSIKTGEVQLGKFKLEYLFPKLKRPWWQFW